MPLVRVSVAQDISNEHLQRISDAVHESMVTTFGVPAKGRTGPSATVPRNTPPDTGDIRIFPAYSRRTRDCDSSHRRGCRSSW